MQLFDLLNSLINLNTTLRKKNLEVIRYNIIPMTNEHGHNGGLIRWIEDSEPVNQIINNVRSRLQVDKREEQLLKKHRQDAAKNRQSMNNEDNHTLLQKIEQFQYVEHKTKDYAYHVAKGIWLSSPSAEVWFEKRTNFTRSLALNSMVGYILGLGDRHVSNILMIKTTGKIAHIDFGDSFEAAERREHVPEKVPFRLTRMFVKAMEVTGVNGTFRSVCRDSMDMFRDGKESIIAVLQSFVNDPVVLETHKNRRCRPVGESQDTGRNRRQAQVSQAFNDDSSEILRRVQDKLDGRDFSTNRYLNVNDQVDMLIREARNIENLCQHYIGWNSHY